MLKQRAFLLLVLCFVIPAQAGLLEDDDARKQIRQLEARVIKLEDAIKLQQTKSMLDLQSQIDALNTEIRNLRGQNEEIAHGLQDAEKRQKDFYVDLDTRLRHFESAEAAAKETAEKAAKEPPKAPPAAVPVDPSDPATENRAIESAYSVFRSGNHADAIKALQEFLKKYPASVHVPNASFWLGSAQSAMKDYKGALVTYQGMLKDYPEASKSADAMYGIAVCEKNLKRPKAAGKTLKQLIAKYPDSEAAAKAKKLLSALK